MNKSPFRIPTLLLAFALVVSFPFELRADYNEYARDAEEGEASGDDLAPWEERDSSRPAAARREAAPAPTRSDTGTGREGGGDFQDYRPVADWSLGIGAGWVVGTASILQPNTAGVRVGFGRFSLEPFVVVGFDESETRSFTDDPRVDDIVDVEQGDQTTALGVGVDGRFDIARRDNVDLQVLGGLTFTRSSANPFARDLVEDEDLVVGEFESFNTRTSLNWGFGIQWFFKRNIALSADAVNPLVSWSRTGQYQLDEVTVITDTGDVTTEWRERLDRATQTDFGLVFDPRIRVMFHLYF